MYSKYHGIRLKPALQRWETNLSICHYRIYSNKRRGAYVIFRATSAALIRGRRLLKHCTRQIYFFYIFIQRYTFYLLIFLLLRDRFCDHNFSVFFFYLGVKLQHSAVAGSQLLHTLPSLAANSLLFRRWQATLFFYSLKTGV